MAVFAAIGVLAVLVIAVIVFLIAPAFTIAIVALIGGIVIVAIPPYPLPKEIAGGIIAILGLILAIVAATSGVLSL